NGEADDVDQSAAHHHHDQAAARAARAAGPAPDRHGPDAVSRVLAFACAAGAVVALGACSGSSGPPAARIAGTPTSTVPTQSFGTPSASTDPAAVSRAGASVSVAALPSVAHRGQMVTAAFNTRPGAACQLQLQGGDMGTPLPPAVADPSGRIAWTWRLSPNADVGTLTAWVKCSGGALAQAQLNVT
ncbi:MAG: hypothetical protein JO248_09330, partial [Acidimicrobiia bacterium]|nr:hypothetical protein [Acidimicrobiia bacterium]